MSLNVGTNVIAPIVPNDSGDQYPTHSAIFGKGGLRTVNTAPDLNTIPADRREEGMLVYVKSEQAYYQLNSDLTSYSLNLDNSDIQTILTLASTFSGVNFYSTNAEMVADTANIPEGRVAEVLVDETRSNRRTLYRKISGVLVFQVYADGWSALNRTVITATAAQTVVNLPFSYTTATSTLFVYINGVFQEPTSYVETSTTSITMTTPLSVGDFVEVVSLVTLPIGTTVAGNVAFNGYSYIPTSNVDQALRSIVDKLASTDGAGTVGATGFVSSTVQGALGELSTASSGFTSSLAAEALTRFNADAAEQASRIAADNTIVGNLSASGGSTLVGNISAVTGAVSRTAQSKFSDVTNAADVGVLPNGTDHSAKMQALIDYVSANGGGTIKLNPASTAYVMQFTMRSGVAIVGEPGAFGQNFTATKRLVEIQMPVTGGDVIGYTAPVGPDPEGGTNLNTVLIGLIIRGRGAGTAGRGISIQAARNAIIHDVAVYDTADEAFYVSDNVRIGNFTQMAGYNCLLNRTRAANTYAARLGGGDHIIADWEFNPGLTALSSASKYIRAIGILGDNVRWDNLIGEFSDVGITIEGLFHHGGRSRGEFSFAEGYDIGCGSARLGILSSDNNSFGSDGVYDGIVLRSTATSNQITQWTNHNDGRGNTRYGLRDDHAGDNDKNYLGLGFSSGDRTAPMLIASSGGAMVQQTADAFVLTAGTATPSVRPWLTEYTINNPSPQTVTAFTGSVSGMLIRLRSANANTTLQHNGTTFSFPRNADIIMQAGYTYVFQRRGAVFVLISGPDFGGISNLGDVDVTLTSNFGRNLIGGVPITANRTITMPTTGMIIGEQFKYSRLSTATGAFNVTFAGRAMAVSTWAVATWNGSAFVITQAGTL